MTSVPGHHYKRAVLITMTLIVSALDSFSSEKYPNSMSAPTQVLLGEARETAAGTQLQGIVKEIMAVWDKADVVCLGEDHGRKNDSNPRIALIEHPDFVLKVDIIIVEFANPIHQDILDRLALEGENIPREELRSVWRDAEGATVWESPIYEAFLCTVRKINLAVPRERRVRLIGGDTPIDWAKIRQGKDLLPWMNRGKFIREAVSREILSKGVKGLAIYGAGHCECRGMGFPGELGNEYPGKIWSAFSFYDVEEGRRVFGLGDEPRLIPITGTERAKIPAAKMFFTGRYNDPATLGDIVNAVVYYGDAKDVVAHADKSSFDEGFRQELERRNRLSQEAAELLRRR